MIPVGTTFITATLPHSFDGNQVQWDFTSLDAGETISVALVVQASLTVTGTVTNSNYGVASDDVDLVLGSPVGTTILTPEVQLTPDYQGFGAPGGVISYTHTLTNFTDGTETYSVTLSSSAGWTSASISDVTLAPMEVSTFVVTANVPVTATIGMFDKTLVTATGQTTPGLSAVVTDTTTVPYQVYYPVVPKE